MLQNRQDATRWGSIKWKSSSEGKLSVAMEESRRRGLGVAGARGGSRRVGSRIEFAVVAVVIQDVVRLLLVEMVVVAVVVVYAGPKHQPLQQRQQLR